MKAGLGVTLVTGAGGMLGSAVIRRLVAEGETVRGFYRSPPRTIIPSVEVVIGDLGDPEAVDRAFSGTTKVIHTGAAMRGGWPEHQRATIAGTAHVLAASLQHRIERFVHISSLSVVDWARSSRENPISEDTPLERRPLERGAYTRAKLEAEKQVTSAVVEGLPAVILRPGLIFDDRGPLAIGGAVARPLWGHLIVLGDGELQLPLVYLDDVVDAVILAAYGSLHRGEIIQLVDCPGMTQNQILQTLGASGVVHLPAAALFVLGTVSEWCFRLLGRNSPISRYRLRSGLAQVSFANKHAERLLGWRPKVGVLAGLQRSRMHKPHPTHA